MVASIAAAASPMARAVRVRGAVRFMSGTADGIPSAAPKRANGPNAATSRSAAVMA